jgi:hypothetical protein
LAIVSQDNMIHIPQHELEAIFPRHKYLH